MRAAIDETLRRRQIQMDYNQQHGITPETVRRNISAGIQGAVAAHQRARAMVHSEAKGQVVTEAYLSLLENEMLQAAEDLEFERAAALRDRLTSLRDRVGETVESYEVHASSGGKSSGRRGKSKGRGKRQA
jgi:excinuclease ABC subunit B